MVVINKGIKGHNSEKMIGKVIEFLYSESDVPVAPKNVKVVKVWTKNGKREYQRYYRDLVGKERIRRDTGLHLKDFQSNAHYQKEYEYRCCYMDGKQLREYIAEHVNGGVFWGDEVCVML